MVAAPCPARTSFVAPPLPLTDLCDRQNDVHDFRQSHTHFEALQLLTFMIVFAIGVGDTKQHLHSWLHVVRDATLHETERIRHAGEAALKREH